MARSDIWRWSATRVEIDQRSREARLRLEQVERLLKLRVLPARSWIRRVLYRCRRHFFGEERKSGRSAKIDATGAGYQAEGHIATEVCVTAIALALSVKAAIGGMVRGLSAA